MKIILSRKGFDSSMGGVASPILPDGSMFSLPIPDPAGSVSLGEVRPHGVDLAQVADDLTRGRIGAGTAIHLDPDLIPSTLPRRAGWRPAFGQCLAAQSHLERHGVGLGDLFLFFGWFRRVEQRVGRFQYLADAPNLHVVFGWLEVGEMLSGDAILSPPEWLLGHPHVDGPQWSRNHIYLAQQRGSLVPEGAGAFRRFSPAAQLTAAESPWRSLWRLPAWFEPNVDRPPLSYHSDPARWKRDGHDVLIESVRRGQEFVLDSEFYPEAPKWAASLIAAGARQGE
jgi:hypothetical protein